MFRGNSVTYCKVFEGYGKLCIVIEASLHETNASFFRQTLSSFETVDRIENITELLYIHSDPSSIRWESGQIETFYCDISMDWHFQCISVIEEYIIKKLNVTTFHSGGVVYQDTTFIFVGERFSGKSTLIHYLCDEHSCQYIDDDNMFFSDGKFWGVALPLRLRTKPSNNDNLILEFFDERNRKRYLCGLTQYKSTPTQKTIIIFPKFKAHCFDIKELHGKELFRQLLISVRHSQSNYEMFQDVSFITRKMPAFYIEYDCCDYVFDCMNKMLENNKEYNK